MSPIAVFLIGVAYIVTPVIMMIARHGMEVEQWNLLLSPKQMKQLQASVMLGILCIFIAATMVLLTHLSPTPSAL